MGYTITIIGEMRRMDTNEILHEMLKVQKEAFADMYRELREIKIRLDRISH